MRKIVLCLVATTAALVAAAPAAAQYFPAPPPPGYGYGQGGLGESRALHAQIDNIERQIDWLASRNRISERRADRLRDEARGLEQRLRYAGRDGLNPFEARDIRFGISRLQQQVRYSRSYGYRDWDDRDRD